MKILVTGGAGYIGSNTSAWLIDKGYEVLVYDNLLNGNLKAVPKQAKFIKGDIGDEKLLEKILTSDIDIVIHFAGLIEAGESMKNPELYINNNVNKGKIFLDSVIRAGIKNFVFSSTAAVYATKNSPIEEDHFKQPASIYGKTKLEFEDLLIQAEKEVGLRYCILRYFNASGACIDSPDNVIRGEAHNPETHLIPNIIKVALGQKDKITIFGNDYPTNDGTNMRDYVHINDLADAHILATEYLSKSDTRSEIFNVGSGKGYSNKEVLETIIKVTENDIPYEIGPRRPGDAPILVANNNKIKETLGFECKYSDLENIVQSAWKWHKTHPNGY